MNRLTVQMAGSEDEALARNRAGAQRQEKWALETAAKVERGELPSGSDPVQVKLMGIAWILRQWGNARTARAPKRKNKNRGNPNFKKVYDPDRVALMVGFAIAFGKEPHDAIDIVADDLEVDHSTVARIFRPRREVVAQWFEGSDLAHRVGAIRGNSA